MIISIFQLRNGDSQSLDKLLKITSLVNNRGSIQIQASCLQSGKVLPLTKHYVVLPSAPTSPSPCSAFQIGNPHPLALYPPSADICLNQILGWLGLDFPMG